MYLKPTRIKRALANLKNIHPFYGITFLVCKRADLPVGSSIELPINALETEFLEEHYRPCHESEYFYRVFRPSDAKKHWIHRHKYASSTLQSIRTQSGFAKVFLHTTNSAKWGWQSDYIPLLKEALSYNHSPLKGKPVPLLDLAIWLYHQRDWAYHTTAQDIATTFQAEFSLSSEEVEAIFDLSSLPLETDLFQEEPMGSDILRSLLDSLPLDISPEVGGTLAYLEVRGVGPAHQLIFEPAERLNIITGDNGLGKTFLLECAWWALTGQWATPHLPAYPRQDAKKSEPVMHFQIAGTSGMTERITIPYDWNAPEEERWVLPSNRPTIPGLLIYARVDGSFAVCDPVEQTHPLGEHGVRMPRSFVFTREQVWNGDFLGQPRPRINGLIEDWVSWQNDPDQSLFTTFTRVLSRLSPPTTSDLGELKVGTPVRLPGDSRKIPTLEHPYGVVPIVHAAAGVKRILTLAYLLVWAWNEHQIKSAEARKEPQNRMVILIDELEAHLHPQWQRRILPALLAVREDLTETFHLEVQSIIATHSPMVLASSEPIFDPKRDKLFHLDVAQSDIFGSEVQLNEIPYTQHGRIDNWLTSEVFNLQQARSLEAEQTIEAAKKLQQMASPPKAEVERITRELQQYLSEADVFWPRWTYFAEKQGVVL